MAYPAMFYRIVLGGTLYTETWNTSIAYAPGFVSKPADASILATIASAVETWHKGSLATGIGFSSIVKLTHVKVNRINQAGHYADPVAQTHVYPAPVAGIGSVINTPPQNAVVVTLRTDKERGLANRGRMYLPLPASYSVLGSDGRAPVPDAVKTANSVASLINNINAAFGAWGGPGMCAVFSNVRDGDFNLIKRVQAGRVVDTMRSRRASITEDYQWATTAIGLARDGSPASV